METVQAIAALSPHLFFFSILNGVRDEKCRCTCWSKKKFTSAHEGGGIKLTRASNSRDNVLDARRATMICPETVVKPCLWTNLQSLVAVIENVAPAAVIECMTPPFVESFCW